MTYLEFSDQLQHLFSELNGIKVICYNDGIQIVDDNQHLIIVGIPDDLRTDEVRRIAMTLTKSVSVSVDQQIVLSDILNLINAYAKTPIKERHLYLSDVMTTLKPSDN